MLGPIYRKPIAINDKLLSNLSCHLLKHLLPSNIQVSSEMASAAAANFLLLKKRADERQRAALRIKFEVRLKLMQILITPYLKDFLAVFPRKLTATVMAASVWRSTW